MLVSKQRCERGEENQGVVGKIAHVESFAPKLAVCPSAEFQRGLAAEECGIGLGKDGVEVAEALTEFISVGIPISQQGEGEEVAQKACGRTGKRFVQTESQCHATHNECATDEHVNRIFQCVPHTSDEHCRESSIGKSGPFNGQPSAQTRFLFE